MQFVTVSADRGLRARELELLETNAPLEGQSRWLLRYQPTSSGNHQVGLRVIPRLVVEQGMAWDVPLLTWA